MKSLKLSHPESEDLAFLYAMILTDGQDDADECDNCIVFADRMVTKLYNNFKETHIFLTFCHYSNCTVLDSKDKSEFCSVIVPKSTQYISGSIACWELACHNFRRKHSTQTVRKYSDVWV